jgi:hypothetical protein
MQFPKLENYLMTEKANGEAPKRRGRPPMTEEQKAANKAAREAAGASAAAGTKPVTQAPTATPKADKASLRAISKGNLIKLLKSTGAAQSEMDDAKAEMGGLVTAAVETQHLHKGAFGWIKKLHKFDESKRQEWLFQLDVMRDHLGWSKTDDLLRTDGVEAGAEVEGDETKFAPPADDEEQVPYDPGPARGNGFTGEDLNQGRVVGFPRSA